MTLVSGRLGTRGGSVDPMWGPGLTFLNQSVLAVQAEYLQFLRQVLGGHGHGDPGGAGILVHSAPT